MFTSHLPAKLQAEFSETVDLKNKGDAAHAAGLEARKDNENDEDTYAEFDTACGHYEAALEKCNKLLAAAELKEEKHKTALREVKAQQLILQASLLIADTNGMLHIPLKDAMTASKCNTDLQKLTPSLKKIKGELKAIKFLRDENQDLYAHIVEAEKKITLFQTNIKKTVAIAAFNCASSLFDSAEEDDDTTPEETLEKFTEILNLMATHKKYGGKEAPDNSTATKPPSRAHPDQAPSLTTRRVYDQIVTRKITQARILNTAGHFIKAKELLTATKSSQNKMTRFGATGFNQDFYEVYNLVKRNLKEAESSGTDSDMSTAPLPPSTAAAAQAAGASSSSNPAKESGSEAVPASAAESRVAKNTPGPGTKRKLDAPLTKRTLTKHYEQHSSIDAKSNTNGISSPAAAAAAASSNGSNAPASAAAAGSGSAAARAATRPTAAAAAESSSDDRATDASSTSEDDETAKSRSAKRHKIKKGGDVHDRLKQRMKQLTAGSSAGTGRTTERGMTPAPALRTSGKNGRGTAGSPLLGAGPSRAAGASSFSPSNQLRLGLKTTGIAEYTGPAAAPAASPSSSTQHLELNDILSNMTHDAKKAAAASTASQGNATNTILQQKLGASPRASTSSPVPPSTPEHTAASSPIPQIHKLATRKLCKIDEEFEGELESMAMRNDETGEKHDAELVRFPRITQDNNKPSKIVFVDFDDTLYSLAHNKLDQLDAWKVAHDLARESGYHFVMLTARSYSNDEKCAAVRIMDQASRDLEAHGIKLDAKIFTDQTNDKVVFMKAYAKMYDIHKEARKNLIIIDNNHDVIRQACRGGYTSILYTVGDSTAFEQLYPHLLASPLNAAPTLSDEKDADMPAAAAAEAHQPGAVRAGSSSALGLFGSNKRGAAAAIATAEAVATGSAASMIDDDQHTSAAAAASFG